MRKCKAYVILTQKKKNYIRAAQIKENKRGISQVVNDISTFINSFLFNRYIIFLPCKMYCYFHLFYQLGLFFTISHFIMFVLMQFVNPIYHQIVLIALIPLTFSCHLSLSAITLDSSSQN